eukprot:tig00020801_g13902.t1
MCESLVLTAYTISVDEMSFYASSNRRNYSITDGECSELKWYEAYDGQNAVIGTYLDTASAKAAGATYAIEKLGTQCRGKSATGSPYQTPITYTTGGTVTLQLDEDALEVDVDGGELEEAAAAALCDVEEDAVEADAVADAQALAAAAADTAEADVFA